MEASFALEPGWLILLVAALALTGVISGLMAGLLGLGGGLVIVPVLYHVFTLMNVDAAVRMHMAVGTSLACIVPTALSSARAHHHRGSLDPGLLWALSPGVALGVIAAAVTTRYLSGSALSVIFGVVALLVASHMIIGRREIPLGIGLPTRWPNRLALGGVIGGLSTLMGIGGGTLSVPLLRACGTPMRRAVGTASAIGVVIAVPGAAGFMLSGLGIPDRPPLSLGYVSVAGFACIIPMGLATAPLGAGMAHRVNATRLRQIFALFLAATAVRVLGTSLGAW
jgi:uncharacterized membrane protein YfcA